MAWVDRVDQGRHLPTAIGICQRRGGVGRQDRWRHGWRHRAPRDGFTACPACPHRPAAPRKPAVAVASAFAFDSAGAGLQALLDPPHTVMVWVSDSQVGGTGHAAAWLPSSTRRRSRGSICGASTCTSSSA
ncbi:transposon-like protein [Stenotrophomonas maltophilia AU12-09]|nr:transposon-like protein [Stenotrophomonas maltophilia AU12-09]